MSKILLIAVGAVVLFLGPLFAWDAVKDYSSAARTEFDELKPVAARMAQAEREIEEGTEAFGKAKAELARIEEEKTRLRELLARAPMPVEGMEKRHEELKKLVAEAEAKGLKVEHAGAVLSPAEARMVLARQRSCIRSVRHYELALAKLEILKTRLEAAVARARQEKAIARADLEYARTLTRVSRAVVRGSDLAGLETGASPFSGALDTLRDVIAVQETKLGADEPATPDGAGLFEDATIRK